MTMATAFEPTYPSTTHTRHIAVVAAGLSNPSSTTMLGNQLVEVTANALSQHGYKAKVRHFELREVATDIADSMVTFSRSDRLNTMLNEVQQADGVVAVTPVFKASYSGLFKSFWDLIDNDALTGVPIQLGATGGSPRHSLVIDTVMRPLFSYLRMRVMPTGVYAATEDWGSTGQTTSEAYLSQRIARAGEDLADVVSRLDPRPRQASSKPKDLEVIPFDQLLNGPHQ